ncbi:TerB family tellurite resistance protein [Coleofasciculus sp. F4-SAH-05]|uniref:TerB family tellurite resistance protein n=1 Tax=unclassified Coleofasciculus TaxID=2692782 RepID=UPI003302851A
MSSIKTDATLWMMDELYGIKEVPPDQDSESFTKAVLICSKGDGTISPEERAWFVGCSAAYHNTKGYELAKIYTGDDDLQKVIGESSNVASRKGRLIIIYVAIKTCSADGGYHPDEQKKIHQMAAQLGIEESVVREVEQLCLEEAEIRQKRLAILSD